MYLLLLLHLPLSDFLLLVLLPELISEAEVFQLLLVKVRLIDNGFERFVRIFFYLWLWLRSGQPLERLFYLFQIGRMGNRREWSKCYFSVRVLFYLQ